MVIANHTFDKIPLPQTFLMTDILINSYNFKHPGSEYHVYSRVPRPIAEDIVTRVLSENLELKRILKDRPKCLVAQFGHADLGDLVLKIPHDRNHRRWERFLTLFRPGESVRQYQNMEKLETLGLNGPLSILAAERRQAGVVTDSFYIYSFIEGREGVWADLPLIVDTLVPLYQKGYRRNDPRVANHIINDRGVYLIDFRVTHPVPFNRLRCAMEYCRLVSDRDAALEVGGRVGTPRSVTQLAWHMQRLGLNARKAKHRLRRWIRAALGQKS